MTLAFVRRMANIPLELEPLALAPTDEPAEASRTSVGGMMPAAVATAQPPPSAAEVQAFLATAQRSAGAARSRRRRASCLRHWSARLPQVRRSAPAPGVRARAGCWPCVARKQGSFHAPRIVRAQLVRYKFCLLYTSDAADDLLCVDLGGRR